MGFIYSSHVVNFFVFCSRNGRERERGREETRERLRERERERQRQRQRHGVKLKPSKAAERTHPDCVSPT